MHRSIVSQLNGISAIPDSCLGFIDANNATAPPLLPTLLPYNVYATDNLEYPNTLSNLQTSEFIFRVAQLFPVDQSTEPVAVCSR